MRENCTYGSMRGIRRKTAKHVLRVAEGRAGVPHGASRSTLHPSISRISQSENGKLRALVLFSCGEDKNGAGDGMRQIIRIGVLVVPWLMAVALPILLFPGFADSNMGSIDFVHLLGFEFVMIPLAPLMLLRCLLANPECSVVLKILMFVVGAVCPLFIALLLARFWTRRWFWFVWVGYLLLLAFDVVVALVLLKEFV